MFVDKIVLGRVNPFESGAVTHDGDKIRRIQPFVPDENGCFPTAKSFDKAVFDFGYIAVVAAEDGFSSHIARGAVSVVGDHQELMGPSGQVDFDVAR